MNAPRFLLETAIRPTARLKLTAFADAFQTASRTKAREEFFQIVEEEGGALGADGAESTRSQIAASRSDAIGAGLPIIIG